MFETDESGCGTEGRTPWENKVATQGASATPEIVWSARSLNHDGCGLTLLDNEARINTPGFFITMASAEF